MKPVTALVLKIMQKHQPPMLRLSRAWRTCMCIWLFAVDNQAEAVMSTTIGLLDAINEVLRFIYANLQALCAPISAMVAALDVSLYRYRIHL